MQMEHEICTLLYLVPFPQPNDFEIHAVASISMCSFLFLSSILFVDIISFFKAKRKL